MHKRARQKDIIIRSLPVVVHAKKCRRKALFLALRAHAKGHHTATKLLLSVLSRHAVCVTHHTGLWCAFTFARGMNVYAGNKMPSLATLLLAFRMAMSSLIFPLRDLLRIVMYKI